MHSPRNCIWWDFKPQLEVSISYTCSSSCTRNATSSKKGLTPTITCFSEHNFLWLWPDWSVVITLIAGDEKQVPSPSDGWAAQQQTCQTDHTFCPPGFCLPIKKAFTMCVHNISFRNVFVMKIALKDFE